MIGRRERKKEVELHRVSNPFVVAYADAHLLFRFAIPRLRVAPRRRPLCSPLCALCCVLSPVKVAKTKLTHEAIGLAITAANR
jgi:hypothetical protein